MASLAEKFRNPLGRREPANGIVRALHTAPCLVLADESTGALDNDTARRVVELLIGCCSERNAAMLIAPHAPALARRTDRIVGLRDRKLVR